MGRKVRARDSLISTEERENDVFLVSRFALLLRSFPSLSVTIIGFHISLAVSHASLSPGALFSSLYLFPPGAFSLSFTVCLTAPHFASKLWPSAQGFTPDGRANSRLSTADITITNAHPTICVSAFSPGSVDRLDRDVLLIGPERRAQSFETIV